jgi:hypothetical protein
MDRREFIRKSSLGLTALVVGSQISVPWQRGGQAYAASQALNFTITDAIKQMVTHTPRNNATCYFWVFKDMIPRTDYPAGFPAEVPGPQVFATAGETLTITLNNDRNASGETMGFAIARGGTLPGSVVFNSKDSGLSGGIAPGASATFDFPVPSPGTYLYYAFRNSIGPGDPLPRLMGLHGALVSMPGGTVQPFNWSPYPYSDEALAAAPGVKRLYDDFGTAPWWPGKSWHAGDAAAHNPAPPFRQYIWLVHEASPVLFAAVGNNANISFTNQNGTPFRGSARDPNIFIEAFVNDAFIATSNDGRANTPKLDRFNLKPHFFTIDGQSGHFAHNHATITPMHRVGEPCLIRIINAGLWTHSMHIHANHVYVTSVDNVPQENPLWVDVFLLHPMGHMDYTLPYMRPPDVPNVGGFGRGGSGSKAMPTLANPPFPGFPGATPHPAWPPVEEFSLHHPKIGTMKKGFLGGTVDIAQRQSPLCFPMHSHSEPDQSTQGGNYNTALISGMYFIGDQNDTMKDFPIDEDFQMMLHMGGSTSATGPAAGKDPM